MKFTSPLLRVGGKGRMSRDIIPLFRTAEWFLEPYFGAGNVFFSLPNGMYKKFAVNDIDTDVIVFFRCLRDDPDELARLISLTPYSLSEFTESLVNLIPFDAFERARRFFVRNRQSFGGKMTAFGRCPGVDNKRREWLSIGSELQAFADKLRTATIDCIDGGEFVSKWARGNCFVYCDPPFVSSTRPGGKCYANEMSDGDHERLSRELHLAVSSGASVAISGYRSALYDSLYNGWQRHDFERSSTISKGSCDRVTECLWTSYSL